MTSIARVTLTVETSDGESHVLVVRDPNPRGGNPRFLGQQFSTALHTLQHRMLNLIDARHGYQTAPEKVTAR